MVRQGAWNCGSAEGYDMGVVTVGFILRFRGSEVVANGGFGDFDMLAVEGISCSVERAEGIAVTHRRFITCSLLKCIALKIGLMHGK